MHCEAQTCSATLLCVASELGQTCSVCLDSRFLIMIRIFSSLYFSLIYPYWPSRNMMKYLWEIRSVKNHQCEQEFEQDLSLWHDFTRLNKTNFL